MCKLCRSDTNLKSSSFIDSVLSYANHLLAPVASSLSFDFQRASEKVLKLHDITSPILQGGREIGREMKRERGEGQGTGSDWAPGLSRKQLESPDYRSDTHIHEDSRMHIHVNSEPC